MSGFKKATKEQAKARIALAGVAGGGKTFTALTLATYLTDEGQRFAVIDTEHGSASKYADQFDFDVMELSAPFHPDRFVDAIVEAAKAGYGAVVVDSLSHAWNGSGGLLEIVDQIAARNRNPNTFAAWKDATPIQTRMVEALLAAPIHIIATMRSKQEYVIEQVESNGRTINVPKKLGMAPVQRDAFEYEFDIFADMDASNRMVVTKTRCPALAGAVIDKPGAPLAMTIKSWLTDGTAPDRATIDQLMLIGNMVRSHVITDKERDGINRRIANGMTKSQATEAIDWLKEALADRKEAEKQDAAADNAGTGSPFDPPAMPFDDPTQEGLPLNDTRRGRRNAVEAGA